MRLKIPRVLRPLKPMSMMVRSQSIRSKQVRDYTFYNGRVAAAWLKENGATASKEQLIKMCTVAFPQAIDKCLEETARMRTEGVVQARQEDVVVQKVFGGSIGQDAVKVSRGFHDKLGLTGVVLTKLDGDARGGAALSVKTVTGAPVKFVGTGEKFDAFEEFRPERAAGRILGMGDVVSLVERAQEQVNEEDAAEAAEKLAKGQFTLDDFLKQMRALRRIPEVVRITRSKD